MEGVENSVKLVIVRDQHLTDGTTGKTITADTFRFFSQRSRDTALRASWRGDGRYKPIDEMELACPPGRHLRPPPIL